MGKLGVNIDETIKRAIKEYDKEKTAQQRKGVLHNTRLLLRHYNDLKQHAENSISTVEGLTDYISIEEPDKDEIYILSIKRSKIKTLIMVAHIDMALDQLKQKYKKVSTIEKYNALEMVYLKNIDHEVVGEKLNCSAITARRWVSHAVSDLSVFLFGIDGMNIM